MWGAIAPNVLPEPLITNTVYGIYGDQPPLEAQASHRSMSPCVKVEAVAVSLLSLPPFYPRDVLQIYADISPDDAGVPFRYQFLVDGVAGLTTGALDEPLSLTLAINTAGQHTIELRVWNCNLNINQFVSDSFDVLIPAYRLYIPLITRDL